MESSSSGPGRAPSPAPTPTKEGFFQAAHGGTLFLDEVGDLPLPMQVKLLRAIQEKVRRLGDTTETRVDVRILSATHQNLARRWSRRPASARICSTASTSSRLRMPPLRERARHPQLAESCQTPVLSGIVRRPVRLAADGCQGALAYAFRATCANLRTSPSGQWFLSSGEFIEADDRAPRPS